MNTTLLPYGAVHTAFLFAVCMFISTTAYRWAFDTAHQEYKELSRAALLMHILFYWVGGGAFAAMVIAGMVQYGNQSDRELCMFLFMIIVVPSICGIAKGYQK